jgi:PAS domain S-box-containing protein
MVDRKKVESTPIPFVADGESGALAILGEIVDVQREYMRDGDPQRMWDELLSSLMRTTASRGGIIGEVEWSPRGIPSLNTRAMAWDIESGTHAALHLDIGLLVSRIIAEQAPVVIDLAETPGASRKGPIGQFLGLPLLSSDRLVGLLGLSNPSERYGEHWAERLQPLLWACASIVESLRAAADRSRLLGELERMAGFLQAVINASTHAILVTSPEGRIETANPAAHRLLDSPDGALIGIPVSDSVTVADVRRTRAMLRRALSNGIPESGQPFVSAVQGFSGIRKEVEVSVGELSLDRERRLVLMLHDITERLQAQAALARATEVIDATPDLILWADPETRLVYMNEGGRQMPGFDAEVDIMRIRIEALAAGDAGSIEAAVQSARSDGVWRGELEFGTMQGERVPVSAVVITDDAYVAVLAPDLTERHEIERLKESFVANVSHELRTPLTAVIGYLELLGEGVLGELTTHRPKRSR